MAKTIEELAEEYTKDWWGNLPEAEGMRKSARENFLAGYQAAQEHAHAALEEAEVRIQELRDQLMEESGGRLKLFKDDADAKAAYQEALEEVDLDKAYHQGLKDGAPQWISVKDRLPEIETNRDDYQRSKAVLWIDHEKNMVVASYVTIRERTRVMTGFSEPPISNFTHWQELPEPPKEEE
jgi:hypothetical protein